MAKDSASFWSIPVAEPKQLRSFGLLMAAASALVGAVLWYREMLPEALWVHGLSICVLGCAIVWRLPLRPLYHGWMLLARILGYVNSHILLAVFFYTAFTTIGLFMRLFRYDPLSRVDFTKMRGRNPSGDRQTYWVRREEHLTSPQHFHRQF